MRISDWSSDVCSSDLAAAVDALDLPGPAHRAIAAVAAGEPGHAVDRLAALRHGGAGCPCCWLLPCPPGAAQLYWPTPMATRAQPKDATHEEIGRASCRERVCQYV